MAVAFQFYDNEDDTKQAIGGGDDIVDGEILIADINVTITQEQTLWNGMSWEDMVPSADFTIAEDGTIIRAAESQ